MAITKIKKWSSNILRLFLVVALTLLLVPAVSLSNPDAAYADDTVYMEKLYPLYYDNYLVGKHQAQGVPAICAEPSLPSPPSGYYTKNYNWMDGASNPWACVAALYFGPGSSGYDPSMWPATWYDGSPMDEDKLEICQHLIISDRYAEDFYSAVYGCTSEFQQWAGYNLIGFNPSTDEMYSDWLTASAAGRQQTALHAGAIPSTFKTYLCAGGSNQKMLSFDPYGWLEIQKSSATPSITDGNRCYRLEGIQYGLYTDAACTNLLDTLTCDTSGLTNKVELNAGTYYVKELPDSTANTGYAIDPDVHEVVVSCGTTNTVQLTDNPQNDPVAMIARKIDTDTGQTYGQGNARLADAEFTVRYYDGIYSSVNEAEASGTPTRTWVIKTGTNGNAYIGDDWKVSGDDLYRLMNGTPVVPIGTLLIQETKAPAGYLLGDQVVELRQVLPQTSVQTTVSFNEKIEKEQVKRGDLAFIKVKEIGMGQLTGIPFRLTSQTTGESHILVTDENGHVDTSSAFNEHSYKTNFNDTATEGEYDTMTGVWFNGASEGQVPAPVNDKLGALPYDTYTLEELPCEANKSLVLLTRDVVIKRDSTVLDLGTWIDRVPQSEAIFTTAYDAADMDKYVMPDTDAAIHDTVQYLNLEENALYTLQAHLVFADTGEDVTDDEGNAYTAESTFITPSESGKTSIVIPFDSRHAQGRDVTVFEKLLKDGEEITSHEDKDDVDQQVRVLEPSIGTTAVDGTDGDKEVAATGTSTVVDTVRYENLVAGKEYTLKGVLMSRTFNDDGEEVFAPATDAEGNAVQAEKTFVPEASFGTVDVTFTFDSSLFANGTELVAYETLFAADVFIAKHEDPEDEGQTVKVVFPTISTLATDGGYGDKVVIADPQAVVDDEVAYSNLIANSEYQIRGILMDKTTGLPLDTFETAEFDSDEEDVIGIGKEDPAKVREVELKAFWEDFLEALGLNDGNIDLSKPIKPMTVNWEAAASVLQNHADIAADLVMAESVITPNQTDGTTHITYAFDASKWIMTEEPVDAVVYELLFKDGNLIAAHADLEDEDQTVDIVASTIGTEATDGADGDHQVYPSKEAKIVDTVRYENLIPGLEYKVSGKLMRKDTGKQLYVDDKPIENTVTFVPNASSGEVAIEFVVDTTALVEKELVAFESVSKDGIEVAAHADIEDAAQTVVVRETPLGSSLYKTGVDLAPWLITFGLVGCVIAAGITAEKIRRRKPNDSMEA